MMHSVSTQFITSAHVHLQVLLCMRLQFLLDLGENTAGSNDNVFSLIVNNISFSPYSAHRYIGLEVNTPVNVEEIPAIVLSFRSRNIFNISPIGDKYDATTKN